ncbi:unnamed protein product [Soboliphyme baturini]|uniref:Uncharacterized protein n=1 Tax=Soboliphyme baturini TaxID=241478 RepID=A0A183IGE7_9BILA|nr:unnamed protein product [Soboliphyme baturini]
MAHVHLEVSLLDSPMSDTGHCPMIHYGSDDRRSGGHKTQLASDDEGHSSGRFGVGLIFDSTATVARSRTPLFGAVSEVRGAPHRHRHMRQWDERGLDRRRGCQPDVALVPSFTFGVVVTAGGLDTRRQGHRL